MAAAAKRRQEMPLNREVLRSARERVGLTPDAAAAAAGAGFDVSQIEEWETGPKTPTVKQARKLAEVYDRPFLEFLARERPQWKPLELVPDFRMHRDEEVPADRYELLLIQSEAEEIRLNAIDLFDMLGIDVPNLPTDLFAQVADSVETVSARVRKLIKLSVNEQIGLRSRERDKFVEVLRSKIEAVGVLVTRNSGLVQLGARGLSFFAQPLPIIVFSSEAPAAQAFTLAHELAHIVLKVSAISGPHGSASPTAKRIEDWCDDFAGAFLVPESELVRFVTKLGAPLDSIEDTKLDELAKRFAVSRHAMLIRLVKLGYAKPEYYWKTKRPQFLREEAAYKGRGRPKYYGSRFRSSRGDLYTGLVLDAWSDGMITNHNAAEFMGIKNIAHLEAIRDRYQE
jgi:Zn-dependent peptidase ImmA (M78 family)